MNKRIILCFDGTWNTPSERADFAAGGACGASGRAALATGRETNVCRLYRSIVTAGPAVRGTPQVKWYDAGVGTNWYDRVAGGAFGLGLSRNIREGYKFLSDTYDDGDEVFVLGFSRGAYTARSLIGMIRNCGLLPKGSLPRIYVDDNAPLLEAYTLYRTRDGGPDTARARAFRAGHRARVIDVRFLGVWDTVGALGVPIESFDAFNKQQFEFHDTELSGIVRNAFHAVAIDEHRASFAPTLWDPRRKPDQVVEQRWFPGSHSDVGGGYEDRRLSDVALAWMQAKAQGCGLLLDPTHIPPVSEENLAGAITDSFGAFLGGLFQLVSARHYRPIGSCAFGNEAIDDLAAARMRVDAGYRPRNPGFERWITKCNAAAAPTAPGICPGAAPIATPVAGHALRQALEE